MKNIQLNKTKFQTLFFIWRLLFGSLPPIETKPYVFVCPGEARRRLVMRAAARFELKKQGRAR